MTQHHPPPDSGRYCSVCRQTKSVGAFDGARKTCRRCRKTRTDREERNRSTDPTYCRECSRTGCTFTGGCKTCDHCRSLARRREQYRADKQPQQPQQRVRITMADHPRRYAPPANCGAFLAEYNALHAEITARGWMIGADHRVTWCALHEHAARGECGDCFTEAAQWQADRKFRMDLERIASAPEEAALCEARP